MLPGSFLNLSRRSPAASVSPAGSGRSVCLRFWKGYALETGVSKISNFLKSWGRIFRTRLSAAWDRLHRIPCYQRCVILEKSMSPISLIRNVRPGYAPRLYGPPVRADALRGSIFRALYHLQGRADTQKPWPFTGIEIPSPPSVRGSVFTPVKTGAGVQPSTAL